jgi:hypothetical protein
MEVKIHLFELYMCVTRQMLSKSAREMDEVVHSRVPLHNEVKHCKCKVKTMNFKEGSLIR